MKTPLVSVLTRLKAGLLFHLPTSTGFRKGRVVEAGPLHCRVAWFSFLTEAESGEETVSTEALVKAEFFRNPDVWRKTGDRKVREHAESAAAMERKSEKPGVVTIQDIVAAVAAVQPSLEKGPRRIVDVADGEDESAALERAKGGRP